MQIRVEKEVYIPYDSGEKQNKTQAHFCMTVHGGIITCWAVFSKETMTDWKEKISLSILLCHLL